MSKQIKISTSMETSDEMALTNKHEPIICPNPKCHRRIEEPILLNNLSRAQTEQYYACPHCFIKLDLISVQPQEQTEKKEEPLFKPPEEEEETPSRCAGYLGYLASLRENHPIPQECLNCPKVLDCVMKKGRS